MNAEIIEASESAEVEAASENLASATGEYNEAIASTTDMERDARETELAEKLTRQEKAAVTTQTTFENRVSPENPISEDDMRKMMDELNKVSSMPDVQTAVTAADNLQPGIKTTADRVAKTTQNTSETAMNKVDEIVKKNISGSEYRDYESVKSEHEVKVKELADSIEQNKSTDDIKKAEQAVNESSAKLEITLKDERVADELEASVGNRKGIIEKMMKYSGLLKYLTGAAALWVLLHYLGKELTGCYQYTGTDSEKIDCPSKNDTCGCGGENDVPAGIKDASKLATFCKSNKKYKDYPFCCSKAVTPEHPTCSGNPGEKGAIYYGWHTFTPASIIAGIPGDIQKLVIAGEDGITGLLKQILKWVLYTIAILIIIYIIYIIGVKIFSKSTKSLPPTASSVTNK